MNNGHDFSKKKNCYDPNSRQKPQCLAGSLVGSKPPSRPWWTLVHFLIYPCSFLIQMEKVLAAFCRVLEIASSEDVVSKVPPILELMLKESGASILEECYEFLYLVTNATGDGVTTLYESGGMKVLAFQMSTFADGSCLMELAIRLLQLMLSKLSLEIITNDYLSELSTMVTVVAREFAVLHNVLKFGSLHLLTAVLSSNYSTGLLGLSWNVAGYMAGIRVLLKMVDCWVWVGELLGMWLLKYCRWKMVLLLEVLLLEYFH